MKVCYSYEMKDIDKKSITQFGIPGIILMENAALQVVEVIVKHIKNNEKVLICCGTGNNGGDGFAIARQLKTRGINVSILLLGKEDNISGDASINYNILSKLEVKIIKVNNDKFDQTAVYDLIKTNDIIVDAIFGTGLCREITGYRKDVINMINDSNNYVISVDIPSGVNSDNSKIMGIAIKANCTVTFEIPKVGLLLYPGAYYAGELMIKPIGIPKSLITQMNNTVNCITEDETKSYLPKRIPWGNKGSFGKITIIAGSKDMVGAAILSGRAAYRTGGGLVRLVVPTTIQQVVQTALPEAITVPYSYDKMGILNKEDIGKLINTIKDSSAIAIGPGLGQDKYAKEILKIILEESEVPIVIDADGLNIISNDIKMLQNNSKIIVTPHIGEMSRLVNKDISYIKDNIIDTAVSFSNKYNLICVLKDARTVIGYPDGSCNINITGNDGMATAGSGDVLTGIIASLIGQGLDVKEAARIGVYLHGKAGDIAIKDRSKSSLIATDICESLGGIAW